MGAWRGPGLEGLVMWSDGEEARGATEGEESPASLRSDSLVSWWGGVRLSVGGWRTGTTRGNMCSLKELNMPRILGLDVKTKRVTSIIYMHMHGSSASSITCAASEPSPTPFCL